MTMQKTTQKNDEIIVKLTSRKYTKEFLEQIRKAAKKYDNMENFIYFCILYHLEGYWVPRRVTIPSALFREVADKAEAQHKTVEELVEEKLRLSLK